jgi:toxin ParE1/3/4
MIQYEVFLTRDAEKDLEELYFYIATHDQVKNADYVLNQIEKLVDGLSTMPERGTYPSELSALGIYEYREVYFKPYRIIYRVMDKHVYIYLIVDGRRNMQSLLERRLLSS